MQVALSRMTAPSLLSSVAYCLDASGDASDAVTLGIEATRRVLLMCQTSLLLHSSFPGLAQTYSGTSGSNLAQPQPHQFKEWPRQPGLRVHPRIPPRKREKRWTGLLDLAGTRR